MIFVILAIIVTLFAIERKLSKMIEQNKTIIELMREERKRI